MNRFSGGKLSTSSGNIAHSAAVSVMRITSSMFGRLLRRLRNVGYMWTVQGCSLSQGGPPPQKTCSIQGRFSRADSPQPSDKIEVAFV